MSVSRVDVAATKKLQDALHSAKEQLAAGAGMALAQWSVLETMLAFVFVSVLDRSRSPSPEGLIEWNKENPQRRMFHTVVNAIISFEVRVDTVSAAIVESDLRKDLKSIWPGIASSLKKNYKSRHEAAHFIFDQIHSGEGVAVFLAPFPTTVTTLDAKRLTRQHLDDKAQRFRELGESVRWFHDAVELQRRRTKGPRAPAPELIQRVRLSLKSQSSKA